MTHIRDSALSKPVIEIVSANRLVSNSCLVKEVNAMKDIEEDLYFESPFLLLIEKDENIHALLLYFDVHLSCAHHKVGFSIGSSHSST